MQKAQRIIKTYRRNRMIVCTICALVTLASTLSVRFISQRNLNQQRVVQFANHAVEELDKVLLPLQAGSEVLLPLIGLPCSVAHLPLRKQAAKLQTVRSIGLVQDGTLYCSSIFGYRNVPVVDILAELPAPQPLLRLTTDRALIKGSPVLIQWTPAAGSSNAGVMEMINIDLLTAMLLEPQLPQISSASLTVDSRHLLYGNGLVDSLPQPENNENYQVSSQRFPFTINVNGPGATALAWHYLPTQLPLAVLLSLLVGYIAWLATAYRMSFSREINLGLAQHEFELFCQPLLNARSQQCIGVEILLRWNNPRQGWISPDVFIPIAEEHHLIVPLTRYVMAETIRQRHVFPMSSQFHVGINVAPSHFRRGVLIKDLNQYWFSAHPIQQLILEITERDALLDVDYRIARELHRKNVKFFILFNLVRLATRYYGVAYGYSKGIDIVKDMGGGFLQKLTEGASILGLFVMGALVNKWTHVNIPLVVSRITDQTGKEHVTTVQTILDQLMPGLVPLLLTFACMWLLRKKVNPLWIIVGFFVIGIAGYACGLLGL